MDMDYIALLASARSKFALYVSIPTCFISIISEFLSLLIFLSLKTFRQNSCSFYLMFMALFNLIRMTCSTSFIAISMAFSTNFTSVLLLYCQIRAFLVATCNLSALICLCLSVIDQYFATCFRPTWQRFSNIRIAHRMMVIITLISSCHAILYLIYLNQLSPTNPSVCISSNSIFSQYHVYGFFITYGNLFPLIAVTFGLLAYRNARSLSTRANLLVRRELDKQLTTMVLVEICVYVCTYTPYSIVNTVSSLNTNRDPILLAKLSLANAITLTISFLSNGNSFYTYICVSKRFRRQAKYVLYDLYINKCRPNRIMPANIEHQADTR
ncbi:unnamed protein product [Adineta ricciae]|uniref:G-protein coupled receptors family 1 profile domain-containing protein n=1 Tax=Adineta ricciae TaxID=249248 RepID=A0A814TCQ8_ADIRI|nr:unnamed protein product [Adineta ricciae]CAF1317141.1 unnamed protein product [Adineta ricciae]